jgi:hypothetical protein
VLASENTDALLPRFLTAASQHFNVLGAGGVLAIVLDWPPVEGKGRARGGPTAIRSHG